MSLAACRLCGAPIPPHMRHACPVCMQVVMAARAAIRSLLLAGYVERHGEHGWYFRPGAQELAALLSPAVEEIAAAAAELTARTERFRRVA